MNLKEPFADDFAKFHSYHLKGSELNPLDPQELRRKKSVQSKLSLSAATAGLGSLGLVTAAGVARKKPGMLRIAPENAAKTADSLKDKGFAVGSVGAGIGGIGGINFASIQRSEANEAKKRKKSPVKKAYNAYTGTESKRYTPKLAFNSPNPEKRREQRQALYTPALAAGGAGAVAARNKIGRATEKADVKTHNKLRDNNVARLARVATDTSNQSKEAFVTNKQPYKDAKAEFKVQAQRFKNYPRPPSNGVTPQEFKDVKNDFRQAKKAKRAAKSQYKAEKKTAKALNAQSKMSDAADVKTAQQKYLKALREPTITSSPKAFKRGKQGAIVGGAGLVALGVGNEIHRRTSGKSYKGHFDKYKN